MRNIHNFILTCCCLMVMSFAVRAEPWRGIIPLRSTTNEVERLLGKSTEATEKLLIYRLSSETAFIHLITKDKPGADLKLLQPGTVADIQVMPKGVMYVSDLGLDESKIIFMRGSSPAYIGFRGYVDKDAGLVVQTSGRQIERIFYFASAKDRPKCPSCSVDLQSLADLPICILCPQIAVTCPDNVENGNNIMFAAAVTVGTPAIEPTYNWTVSEGTIVTGQGTSAITVDASKAKGKTITATVEVTGIDSACANKASCSTPIR